MTTHAPAAIATGEPQLGLADRLQPFLLLAAIGGGLTIGRLAPSVGAAAGDAVSVGVFVLIALVMLNINPRNVARTLTNRRFLCAVVAVNFVVNPFLAWGLGHLFLAGQPDLRVGLLLFLVTPCIGWYLIFTELAGGDTELGVGLLGINVVLQVLLLPVYLAIFVGGDVSVGIDAILISIGLYLVIPAAVASTIRRWWTRCGRVASEEQQRLHLSVVKTIALVAVIVSMFASQADAILDDLGIVARLGAPMFVFFAVVYILATAIARRMDFPHEQTALLVFTTASRNSEASLAIAVTAFANPLVALTVALGPVVELPLLIVMTRLLRRRIPIGTS